METQSTEFSARVNQAIFTNANFAPSFPLVWGFFLGKKQKKKKNHNPNSGLAKPGPFKARKFPRATLDKPGGPILLSGMSVRIRSGSADCGGAVAAEGGSSLGPELLVSHLEVEQSSQQGSPRANSPFKGHNQQKDPTPSFKNSSFLLSHVLEARALFCSEQCGIKQLRPLAGWFFQGCQMFCLGHVRSVLLEFRLSLLSGCPLELQRVGFF